MNTERSVHAKHVPSQKIETFSFSTLTKVIKSIYSFTYSIKAFCTYKSRDLLRTRYVAAVTLSATTLRKYTTSIHDYFETYVLSDDEETYNS